LIRAARIGSEDYCRETHLPRLLGYGAIPRPGAALLKLMELEADQNDSRKRDDTSYSIARHVDILVAMMGEARLLRDASPLAVVR
jgi:hypothetical protein